MSKIVLTDATTPGALPSGKTQLYTKSGGAPGTDGLYYRQGGDPEVGPIIAGGSVNDLQDAYDGGRTIAVTTLGGGPVSISSTLAGGPDALAVSVGASTNATGVIVTNSGPGAALVAESLGSGNAVEVETNNNKTGVDVKVNGTGVTARGLTVVLTTPGSQGAGIEVDINSTQAGIDVEQLGTGRGVFVVSGESTALEATVNGTGLNAKGLVVALPSLGSGTGIEVGLNSTQAGINVLQAGVGNGIYVVASASTSNAAIQAVSTNPASTGPGIAIDVNLSPGAPGQVVTVSGVATANALEVRNPVLPVFSVDKDGDTTTPSVIFGGSRITVAGDSNVVGSPIDPRVTATSGSVYLGRLVRVLSYSISLNGPYNLETDPFVIARHPTVFYITNNTGSTQPVTIHRSDRYANGTEIVIVNLGGNSIQLIDGAFGSTQTLISISTASISPQLVAAGAGRRFTARNPANGDFPGLAWMRTGLVP